MITFYDQYFFLQEERVRLAKLGYESASDEEILDQMSVAIETKLKKIRDILNLFNAYYMSYIFIYYIMEKDTIRKAEVYSDESFDNL